MLTGNRRVHHVECSLEIEEYIKIANHLFAESMHLRIEFHDLCNESEAATDQDEKRALKDMAFGKYTESKQLADEAHAYLERARLQPLTRDLMDKIGLVSREEFERAIFKARLRGDEFDETYLRTLYERADRD
jgi:hypothetical protein